jgi:hypothetical protein
MYSCMVGSYAASTMPTTMVLTYYARDADCPTTYAGQTGPLQRQIDSEKRPDRPGDDASPLGEDASPLESASPPDVQI